MSVYIYITAEIKKQNEWSLYAPMIKDSDWNAELIPPLIINGGWPALAQKIIDEIIKRGNLGLPPDASDELRNFYNNHLKDDYSVGWGMYSKLKKIKIKNFGGDIVFSSLFSKISKIKQSESRLICWWSY